MTRLKNPLKTPLLIALAPLCAFFLAQITPALAAPDLSTLEFDRIQNSSLILKSPRGDVTTYKTELLDASYVGTLLTKAASSPYILLAAKPVSSDKHLSSERSLYLLRPQTENKLTQSQLVFPGKIVDPKSQGAILESRAFFGRCLPEWNTAQKGDQYIAFHRERVDRRRGLQQSVLVIEVGPEGLIEKLHERNLPRLSDTLKPVNLKLCKEIEGRNRLMARRPYDLSPKLPATTGEDEDEEDSPTKENQTDKDLPPSSD
jgi:hypothetical protein